MPTIQKHSPPANLTDFDSIADHGKDWGSFISNTFDNAIARVESKVGVGRSQYYNETKTASDEFEDANIVWDAFPKVLLRQYGRDIALQVADKLELVEQGQPYVGRIQDEYCEWKIDIADQNIKRVTFTCEGPEYWASIAGSQPGFGGAGNEKVLVELYGKILGHNKVEAEHLFFPGTKQYNPWNKWNSTEGIVHLHQVNNNLGAEITIGGDATVRREKGGTEIDDPTQFICCGGFGEVNRSSDPTMGAEISSLARKGYALTLRDPVGIYFHEFTNAGITKPGPNNTRVPAGNYWQPIRGTFDPHAVNPGNMKDFSTMVVRAVYQVPDGELRPDGKQLTISDLQIDGSPIKFGGQLAERIRMKFIARKTRVGSISNEPVACQRKCCRVTLPNGKSILVLKSLTSSCDDVFPISTPPMPSPDLVELSSHRIVERAKMLSGRR